MYKGVRNSDGRLSGRTNNYRALKKIGFGEMRND